MNTLELQAALESVFRLPVVNLLRVPFPYSSSFPLEELDVTFDSGERVMVIFKNLSSAAMLKGARAARPAFLDAPEREIQVYRSLLSSLELGTPELYGATVVPALRRYWLFLEKVPALELSRVGEFELWLEAARWLARLHGSSNSKAARVMAPQLLEYDASYYWRWLERAHESAGVALDRIAARYHRVIDVLTGIPQTFIHGEFYASNILVRKQGSDVRICPVDWEMAATGPGLHDVAALASGKWTRDERQRILEAYSSQLTPDLQFQNAAMAFDCCQLHIAIQWLGWSAAWSPPEEHAQDWLAEALRISTENSLATLFR